MPEKAMPEKAIPEKAMPSKRLTGRRINEALLAFVKKSRGRCSLKANYRRIGQESIQERPWPSIHSFDSVGPHIPFS